MATFPRYVETGECVLGVDAEGEPFFLKLAEESAGVDFSLIGVFPPKQLIGDPTAGSHQLLSEFTQTNWAGGGQIRTLNEATDVNRYDFGTLDSRWPRMLALLPLTTALMGPNVDNARPLGMFNDTFVVAWGTALRVISGDPPTQGGGGALTATPLDTGAVEFTGTGTKRLFIPQGTAYQTWNGTVVAAGAVGVDARHFVVWDHRLYVLETDGQIKYTLDGTTWSSVQATLDPSFLPRRLEVFLDRGENLTMHVITDSAPWAFAPDIPELIRVQWRPPRHPSMGLGSTVFDNELCICSGMGVYAYSGPTTRAIGLDRDDGLPEAMRGKIVSLTSEQNGLIALVEGRVPTEAVWFGDEGALDSETRLFTGGSQSSVQVWDRRGWHTLWMDEAAGGAPTNVQIESRADGTYRIWWGVGDTLYWQTISTEFANPKESTVRTYAPTGRLWFGEFDGGMENTEKVAASVEVNTLRCTATEVVAILASTDGGITYETVTEITTNGRTVVRFGDNGLFPDGNTWYEGLDFKQLKLAIDMRRDPADTSVSPVVESVVVAYMKKMGDLRTWQFVVDCQEEFKGHGPKALKEHLRAQVRQSFIPFCYQDEWFSVKVAGVSGRDATGLDLGGNRFISLAESFES